VATGEGTWALAAVTGRTEAAAEGTGAGVAAACPGLAGVPGRVATADGDGAGIVVATEAAGAVEGGGGGNAGASMGWRKRTTAIPTLTASATSAKASRGHGRGAGPPRRARFTGVAAVDADRPPRDAGFELPPPLAASAPTCSSR
jgi:hypothetical protein